MPLLEIGKRRPARPLAQMLSKILENRFISRAAVSGCRTPRRQFHLLHQRLQAAAQKEWPTPDGNLGSFCRNLALTSGQREGVDIFF
jgi:hypothetical protein